MKKDETIKFFTLGISPKGAFIRVNEDLDGLINIQEVLGEDRMDILVYMAEQLTKALGDKLESIRNDGGDIDDK